MPVAHLKQIMRPVLESTFTDKETNQEIHYKQLQLEYVDPETNAIEITRVSIPSEMFDDVLQKADVYQNCLVLVEVDQSTTNRNAIRNRLHSSEIIKLEGKENIKSIDKKSS